MGWRDRIRGALDAVRWDGRTGPPRSSNGASSLHLRWAPGPDGWEHVGAPIVEVAATLEITDPPAVRSLYFWALQASMAGPDAQVTGGAHLGLQWHSGHPDGTAVNWGGYRSGGGELQGSASVLPSATGNVNTRDFAWLPSRGYRCAITRVGDGGTWAGTVTDTVTGVATTVRTLECPGDRLLVPLVWSEVFADCDAPSTAVRWSALTVVRADGTAEAVEAVRTSYQAVADGGCAETDSRALPGGGFEQRTSTPRTNPPGATLRDQSQSSRS